MMFKMPFANSKKFAQILPLLFVLPYGYYVLKDRFASHHKRKEEIETERFGKLIADEGESVNRKK